MKNRKTVWVMIEVPASTLEVVDKRVMPHIRDWNPACNNVLYLTRRCYLQGIEDAVQIIDRMEQQGRPIMDDSIEGHPV